MATSRLPGRRATWIARTAEHLLNWVAEALRRIFAARSHKLREWPNPYFHAAEHDGGYLAANTRLTRILNLKEYRDHGWSVLSYNTSLIDPDSPKARGRFSSIKGDEQYAYMYVGSGKSGLRVAVWEVIELEALDPHANTYYIPFRLQSQYGLVEMQTTRRLYIVNIRNQDDAQYFRADLRALQGDDYSVTRAWARYIRRMVPKADGLRYMSVRAGSGRHALALFEDWDEATERRRRSPRKVRRIGNAQFLRSFQIQRRIMDAMLPTKVAFGPAPPNHR